MLAAVVILIAFAIFYGWRSFPIISGFGAKDVCSCMFVGGRSEDDVKKQELGAFPFTLGRFKVNMEDSSVTGSVLGLARRKAIYRPGLGCTIVNDLSEEEIRNQKFRVPVVENSDRSNLPWPLGDKISDSFPSQIDRAKLDNAVNAAFDETDSTKKKRTRAVIVLYDGQIVAEKYASGFDQNSKMHGWSIAKSITAALVGVLVKQGKININDKAPIESWKGTPKENITIKHLLQQTSGLAFREDYSGYSEVTNMLFNEGNMAEYTEKLDLLHPPGTVFNYSSGNSNILSWIVRKAVGESDYHSFPYEQLFRKTGMHSAMMEPDASGTFIGSSYFFANARDYARFGLLYYNNGIWNGEQLFPLGWVDESATPADSNKLKNYGYQFWINGYDKHNPKKITFPDAPADVFYADGYAYQDVYIIRSKKLVVVRLGLTLDKSFDENLFLKSILGTITDNQKSTIEK